MELNQRSVVTASAAASLRTLRIVTYSPKVRPDDCTALSDCNTNDKREIE